MDCNARISISVAHLGERVGFSPQLAQVLVRGPVPAQRPSAPLITLGRQRQIFVQKGGMPACVRACGQLR